MIINIDNLERQITQIYARYYRETRAIIDSKYLWFDISRNKDGAIWLSRKYSDVAPNEDKIYNIQKILNKWVGQQNITDNDYLHINLYGNGLKFSIMRDEFGVLDKSDTSNDLNLDNIKRPKPHFFGRVGL